jgi:4'-phosphopantetheinyl transferase EntD
MPLLTHKSAIPCGEWGLWAITESEYWLRDQLLLYPAELRQLSDLKGAGRRREWLAARYLVHLMSGRTVRGAFLKDEYGKPHLEGSDWQISISHTQGLAAALAAPRLCGIDVQRLVPKITRLAPKFMNEAEAAVVVPDPRDWLIYLHLLWGAKEALYKAHGRRKLDFRANLHVRAPDFSATGGEATGVIRENGKENHFTIRYQLWEEDVLLVYAVAAAAE